MHGCVLDALYELHQQTADASYLEALQRQLGQFLVDAGVDYEGPTNNIQVNSFSSIELTLPFAVIAKLYPEHPSIPYALQFLYNHMDSSGLVTDGWATTAEGCYTVAYPLMVIGRQRDDAALVKLAMDQLLLRRDALWMNNTLFLRNNNGYRSFQHWARGICWYFLGHVRTLIASGQEPSAYMLDHLRELAAYVASHQTSGGLWRNFINDPNQLVDTSGSSGIACALALAASRGWIDAAYLDRAAACHTAVQQYLVDGGFLSSVAPNNKLGESEQRANKRTCEPFALGLYGQLHAALLAAGAIP
jgi:rhamnogalacturonyl hydrolase YesR